MICPVCGTLTVCREENTAPRIFKTHHKFVKLLNSIHTRIFFDGCMMNLFAVAFWSLTMPQFRHHVVTLANFTPTTDMHVILRLARTRTPRLHISPSVGSAATPTAGPRIGPRTGPRTGVGTAHLCFPLFTSGAPGAPDTCRVKFPAAAGPPVKP